YPVPIVRSRASGISWFTDPAYGSWFGRGPSGGCTKPPDPGGPRGFARSAASADDDREHVAGRQHEVLVGAELHLGAAVLAVQHAVADGDVERNAVAVVIDATGAHGHDLALLGLL